MSDQADTLPTTQNILDEMRAGFEAIRHQLSQMDIRLDRIESFAHQTRSEVLALRADIKELRTSLKESVS
jgi:predicted  nucleic acid-binding Zn-ribbon protein